jgi:hypothetical protein
MNATISRVEKTLERQQARIQALEAALAPFAQAWEFRRPSGNGDAVARRLRQKRCLDGFYTARELGSERTLTLTGQHLKDAHDALKAKP